MQFFSFLLHPHFQVQIWYNSIYIFCIKFIVRNFKYNSGSLVSYYMHFQSDVHTHTHTHTYFFIIIPWYTYLQAVVGCQQTSQISLTWLCRLFFIFYCLLANILLLEGGQRWQGCVVCVLLFHCICFKTLYPT